MAWGSYRDFDHWPRPSRPREAKGGIKAQSKQGRFGESWWAKRWIQVLESFGWEFSSRLQRGRSYARRGQVLSIQIATGEVTAKVQGSRPQPYAVKIRLKPLTKAETAAVGKVLAAEARFAARLLAGEMPQDIEAAFEKSNTPLFPRQPAELETDCSCPDWSNPCKHIAAVYYLLGEEFDRDPFLIFKLRGLDREEILQQLGGAAGAGAGVAAEQSPAGATEAAGEPEPLDPTPGAFWTGAPLPAGWLGEARPPALKAALPKRLGKFPFWRGTGKFLEAVASVYPPAAANAQRVLLGETTSASPPSERPPRKHRP